MFVWFIKLSIFLSQKVPLRSIAHIRGTFLIRFFLPKMVKKMGLNQNFTVLFNPNFNDKFVYICSSFLNKNAQLIHLGNYLSETSKWLLK